MDPGLCVLLAEDDPDEAFLIQRAFQEHGLMHPPHLVHDGAAAISYIRAEGIFSDRQRYRFPNMIILDLKMPGVDGFGVLRWLREHPDFQVIPKIVWSSSADVRDVKHAYCLGANAYLRKPTDFSDFKAMLGRLLAHWDDCETPFLEPNAPACGDLKDKHPYDAVHGRS